MHLLFNMAGLVFAGILLEPALGKGRLMVFSPIYKKSFTVGVLIFVGGNLLVGLTGNIDNAAHVGGLISGLAAGYILYPGLKAKKEALSI